MLAATMVLMPGCTLFPRREVPAMSVLAPTETRVPARIISNFFLVESRQDNGTVARFLIDTGSSATLVSRGMVEQLGQKPDRKGLVRLIRVRTANGSETELPSTVLRKLMLGDASFTHVPVAIFDFSELSNHLGVQVDGVLGFPLFRDVILTLDYPQSTLVLASPRNPPPSEAVRHPSQSSMLAFGFNRETPIIPVLLDGESFNVLVDSGSDGGLTLNTTGLHPRFLTPPRPGTIVSGLSGERRQQVGRLAQSLVLGSHSIQSPVVDLTDQLSSIGGELLRNFRITMDQYRRTVVFRRNAAGPILMGSRRTTGISFSRSPKYWRVIGIIPGTPAADLPVKVNDMCIRINAESVDQWGFERYEELVRKQEAITYTFASGDGGHEVKVPAFDLVP